MNTKKNQGYQKTHQHIQDCFLHLIETKEVSHITIREICEAVSINRSTFYAHFQDIYAVMEEIQEHLNNELLASYSLQENLQKDNPGRHTEQQTETFLFEIIVPFLQHFKNHRRFYQALLSNTNNLVLRNSMDLLQTQLTRPLLDKYHVDVSSGSYYFNFMKAGFLTIIKQWLDHNCPEPPEKFAQLIVNLNPLYYKLLSEEFLL